VRARAYAIARVARGWSRHRHAFPTAFATTGDTGYRFVIASEPDWQPYIDQAATVMGATKIRTWFASGRHEITALLDASTGQLNVSYWQGIEARVLYSLKKYPWVQLQLILFGEDEAWLRAAAGGDAMLAYLPAYAQARWSAFANVQFCVLNDRNVAPLVDVIGSAMARREPWGTLLTRCDPAVASARVVACRYRRRHRCHRRHHHS
jgi:hypothetical protein